MKKGYYAVKFYNHENMKIMFWNGDRFEGFKSDEMPNDEIEKYHEIGSRLFDEV